MKIGVEQVYAYAVCNRATLRKLFDLVGRPVLCWNMDPGHFVFHDESWAAAVEEFGRRIASVHVKDARSLPDPDGAAAGTLDAMPDGRKFEFVAPGTGEIDQTELIRSLVRVNYEGALILELAKGLPNRAKIAQEFPSCARRLLMEKART